MRTAQELRDFAQEYLPDKFFKVKLEKVAFELIEQNLNADEEILFAFAATTGNVRYTSAFNIGVAVSKDRIHIVYRPISISAFFVKSGYAVYNLKEVSFVGFEGFSVNVSVRDEDDLVFSSWSLEARNFIASEIRKIVDAKQEELAQKCVPVAEELKNLKELLDSGVITQDEFDAKKKQYLGL